MKARDGDFILGRTTSRLGDHRPVTVLALSADLRKSSCEGGEKSFENRRLGVGPVLVDLFCVVKRTKVVGEQFEKKGCLSKGLKISYKIEVEKSL